MGRTASTEPQCLYKGALYLTFFLVNIINVGPPRAGSGPVKKKSTPPLPPSKGGPAKNLYTKSEGATLSCRVNWAWSERVNLYNRKIMILPKNTKTYAEQSVPEFPFGRPGPRNLYLLPRRVSALVRCSVFECSCKPIHVHRTHTLYTFLFLEVVTFIQNVNYDDNP